MMLTLVLGTVSGTKQPRAFLIVVAFSAVGIFTCLKWFGEPYLEAAKSTAFQTVMLASSSIWAVIIAAAITFVLLNRAERAEVALEAAHAQSEALLYNLLPEDIAARLKVEPDQTIADSLPQVAILFADIVDFTPRAATLPPEEVVGFLNRIFSQFDELAEKHGLEKIKTIGDAYMVAAGMPSPVGDPVHRIAEMALDMQRTAQVLSREFPDGLQVRIGLHAVRPWPV